MEIPQNFLEAMEMAHSVAVLTGAGVSAESGIETFRDPGGLWSKFNPMELASIEGFMSNSELVWEWYNYRRSMIADTGPNPGHESIAKMEEIFPDFTLITQNVDRLHQQAGSKKVLELHGNIIENHCFDCKKPYEHEIDLSTKKVPLCPHCNGKVRPSVVWFGEMLPFEAIDGADIVARKCDLFFSVGTSAEVYPAANLPIIAKDSGAFVVEVNPNETAISRYMDVCLREPSGVALPQLLEKFEEFLKREK